MAGKFSFRLSHPGQRPSLPAKIIVGQQPGETDAHVLLKALAFLLFDRERLEIGIDLHQDAIPFRPDIVQLDYEMRPQLWIECGDCSVAKLDKLAVKVPDAEIWVMRRSLAEAEELARLMRKADLRRHRYQLLGWDADMFDEVLALLRGRNEVFWVAGSFEPPLAQFEFNGLWFEGSFSVLQV